MPAWLGFFFLISGFSGLVYETVWLRLAMGGFGVTAPSVALFLSVFMGGLGLGSWAAGAASRRLRGLSPRACLRLYGTCELSIAACAALVPAELSWARGLLSGGWSAVAWDSAGYYAAAGGLLCLVLLPACAAMGATYPLAMVAVERRDPSGASSAFSFLYLSNVVGAAAGAFAAALALIELLGFRGAGLIAVALNACAGAGALALSVSRRWAGAARPASTAPRPAAAGRGLEAPALLFCTGLASMAMELAWIRQLTPFLGTTIYAFANVLGVYLVASFAGSWLYRRQLRRGEADESVAWVLAGPLALLPIAAADPYLPGVGFLRVLAGIAPLSAALGYVTPALVDRWSGGDPDRAGRAYAVNILGCIAGPLLAGFGVLPRVSERAALVILALPLFAAGALAARRRPRLRRTFAALVAAALLLAASSPDFESWMRSRLPDVRTARDYQADVLVAGEGRRRILLVNGTGMTSLTTATKLMAHLPLALLPRKPAKALVICFGMGTTFRSLLSWGVDATAVELVPSVPSFFGYFHADGARVAALPNAHVVIDDGRRFLARDRGTYDVITVDPPPPLVSAGTSLLYSTQFYALVKRRLAPDGVLQQWFVNGMDPLTTSAFAQALRDSFPYTRMFHTPEGYHVLASRAPLASWGADVLLRRMPASAVADLGDFTPDEPAAAVLRREMSDERPIDSLILPGGASLSDDRPVNEYFLVRNLLPGVWSRWDALARAR